jgi:hypothetical protein
MLWLELVDVFFQPPTKKMMYKMANHMRSVIPHFSGRYIWQHEVCFAGVKLFR